MPKHRSILDISNEFIIVRHGGGIKLLKPDENISNQNYSVGKVMQWELNIYFMDLESRLQIINDTALSICGWLSSKEAVNRTVSDVFKKDDVELTLAHDRAVVQNQTMIIRDHTSFRIKDELGVDLVCFKFPWYNENNLLIGIFGYTIPISPNNISVMSLSDALTKICKMGLLVPEYSKLSNNACKSKYINKLSKREKECFYHLSKGKTNKKIASLLQLSPKTIEHYIENMKFKLDITSLPQLRENAIDYFSNSSC